MSDVWNYDDAIMQGSAKADGAIMETRHGRGFDVGIFGPLRKYVEDQTITDIDYNGSDIWMTDITNRHWKSDMTLEDSFVQRLVHGIANSESKEFNQMNPVLEVETDDLRISVVHRSIAQTGTSFCVRKTPKVERINEKYAVESGYCSKEILSLLANCIKAHFNIIICGEPRAGKTELAKFVSGYIPVNERVITIEDVLEWHYKSLHPDSDVIEMKINKDFDYSDGIIASLKQNPMWIMIAETRGREIKHLIQSFTTGVNGITTLHTDDVRKIPERMINMFDDSSDPARMESTIFSFVDVGILVSLRPDENGRLMRVVDQVAFFTNEDGVHETTMILEDGKFSREDIPCAIARHFKKSGVVNPFDSDEVNRRLYDQGFDFKSYANRKNKTSYISLRKGKGACDVG